MWPVDDIFVLSGVITSLCLDTVSARMGVGHLLLPVQLSGRHWVMICVIWCSALTVSDVYLKLSFQWYIECIRGIALCVLYKFTHTTTFLLNMTAKVLAGDWWRVVGQIIFLVRWQYVLLVSTLALKTRTRLSSKLWVMQRSHVDIDLTWRSYAFTACCLLLSTTVYLPTCSVFYRVMLRRARYCYGKSSDRPSVHNVDVPWSHWLEIFENNFTVS